MMYEYNFVHLMNQTCRFGTRSFVIKACVGRGVGACGWVEGRMGEGWLVNLYNKAAIEFQYKSVAMALFHLPPCEYIRIQVQKATLKATINLTQQILT